MASLDVDIDLSQLEELAAKIGGLPAALEAVIPLVAVRTHGRILEMAGEELETSFSAYEAALSIDESTSEVVLDASKPGAELAWQIENGTGGGDMKDRLQGRPYMHIPFAHSPAGSKSKSATPMGTAYAKFGWWKPYAKQIGKQAYDAAKKLGPGQRLGGLGHPTAKVHHSFPLYQGMQRLTSGPKGGKVQYQTFRTLSENSKGWKYPAKAGHFFFRRVAPVDIAVFVDEAVQEILGQ